LALFSEEKKKEKKRNPSMLIGEKRRTVGMNALGSSTYLVSQWGVLLLV
jgi:hypothetical protein